MKVHLTKFIFSILVLGTIIILVGGYFNLIPKAALFMGTNKPKDLSVRFSDQTINNIKKKSGIISSATSATAVPTYIGSKELEISLDSQELTAWARNRGWESYPVSNAQIKISNNGSIEASATVLGSKLSDWITATGGKASIVDMVKSKIPVKLKDFPVYFKGTASVTNNQVSIYFDKLQISNIPIPMSLLNDNKEAVDNFVEERIDFVAGLYIKKLYFENGKMNFVGTVPEKEIILIR
ncbi:hypothetical protein GYA27_03695 [candidate division WWE3 bacterium]|uniref:Uncharacterized protein n=1 Tax=candidate division WWE3 bacterium TaxID=2053526 RepID=A0A7X9DKV2_UNCKA|nr:hypothetical protein [candidate division WWE3 bacterium]